MCGKRREKSEERQRGNIRGGRGERRQKSEERREERGRGCTAIPDKLHEQMTEARDARDGSVTRDRKDLDDTS
jgi:hypothetical protein